MLTAACEVRNHHTHHGDRRRRSKYQFSTSLTKGVGEMHSIASSNPCLNSRTTVANYIVHTSEGHFLLILAARFSENTQPRSTPHQIPHRLAAESSLKVAKCMGRLSLKFAYYAYFLAATGGAELSLLPTYTRVHKRRIIERPVDISCKISRVLSEE